MSSFPTVQLEGPRLMKQPSATQVYQEERTILPEPNIQISEGIDWQSIGKEAASLGINIVQGMREDEFSLRTSVLQKEQEDTEKAIRAAVRLNDFASVDSIKGEYKKRSTELLGGDPDDDTFIGTNMSQRKLLNQARMFNSNIDSYLDEQKADWQESIEFDNYTTYSISRDKRLLEDPTYIDTAIEELNTLFKQYGGGDDMSQPLKTTGLSVNQRKLLFQIQKDSIDLLEAKQKMQTAPRTLADKLSEQRQAFSIVSDTLKRSLEFVNKAAEIESRPNITEEERSEATRLRSEALRQQTFAYQTYKVELDSLIEQAKDEIRLGITDSWDTAPDLPQEFDEPNSLDSLLLLMKIGGFKPEDATALKNAFDDINKLESTSPDFKTVREINSNVKKAVIDTADSILSIAKANIEKVDNELRMVDPSNTASIQMLQFQRQNLIEQLHKDLYFAAVDPYLSREYKTSKLTEDFIGRTIGGLAISPADKASRSPFMAFIKPDRRVLLPFDNPNSYQSAVYLSRDNYGMAAEVYLDVQKKFNGLVATQSNVPTPLGGSRSGGKLTKDEQDIIDAHLYATSQPVSREVNSSDQRNFAMILAKQMAGTTELGLLPDLQDILDGKVQLNQQVPFTRSLFTLTPWYDQMIDRIRFSGSKQERDQIIDKFERLFPADEMGDQGYTLSPDTKRKVASLFDEEIGSDTLEMVFLISPSDTRAHILEHINREGSGVGTLLRTRLKALHTEYKKGGERTNPREFLRTMGNDVRLSGETQTRVNEVIKDLKSNDIKDGKYTGQDERLKAALKNKQYIDDTYIPAVIQNLGEDFGIKPEDMGNIAIGISFKEKFQRDLVEAAHLYIDSETGRINMTQEQLNDVAGSVAKQISSSGYSYSTTYGFTKDRVDKVTQKETTLTSIMFENNSGSDPGREQRLPTFLGMNPEPQSLSTGNSETFNLTVSAYTSKKLTETEQSQIREIAKKNPFEALVVLGMYRGRTSNVSDKQMLDAVSKTVVDMPKDNLTILAVTAASRLIGVDTLSNNYATRLKELSIDVRNSIESKDGRYTIAVVDAPSNIEGGGLNPTIMVLDGDRKKLSSIQPREHNFNNLVESVGRYKDNELVAILNSNDASNSLKKKTAIEYMRRTKSKYVLAETIKKPWDFGIGDFERTKQRGGDTLSDLPTEETRKIFFIESNPKTGKDEVYSAEVFTGGWYVKHPLFVDFGSHGFREVSGTKELITTVEGTKKSEAIKKSGTTDMTPLAQQRPIEKYLFSKIQNPNTSESDRKEAATKLFLENPNHGPVGFNERTPKLFGIPGTPERDVMYASKTKDGKIELIQAKQSWSTTGLAGTGSWYTHTPKVIGEVKASKKQQDMPWQKGNLSVSSATLFPDIAIDADNPLYVEIRRYKDKYYIVRKDSKDTSQYFGAMESLENAQKYVERMERFLTR